MKLVLFSDTHGNHCDVSMPDGDMLIFAGDMCRFGYKEDIISFNEYLGILPHRYKIVIAGNHDRPFEEDRYEAARLLTNAEYLQDESIEIEGTKIYGSPWQPKHENWYFNLPRGERLREKWDLIPGDTDILITHGPPAGILDSINYMPVGCADLWEKVKRIAPRLHVFGHIHNQHGMTGRWDRPHDTIFVNASLCDTFNHIIREPITLYI